MLDILRKIFPSANQRRISEYTKIVNKINALEEEMSSKDENFFKELFIILVLTPMFKHTTIAATAFKTLCLPKSFK